MSECSRRLIWIDTLRGAALVGMVAYHAAWDLHAFGVSSIDPGTSEGWRLLGRGVAALFLALSGFSLSLAISRGRTSIDMILRLLRLAGAAGLVSLATWLVAPQSPIWFGILHCIVLTNIVAIGLRRLPNAILLIVAAAAWLAPQVLAGSLGSAWAWTGLSAAEPVTLDFRPVLPWLAPVLIGLSLGRTRLGRWSSPSWLPMKAVQPLAWAGRHSLAIYLIHQPLLLAAVIAFSHSSGWTLGPALGLQDPGQAGSFLRQCRSNCQTAGGDDSLCRSTCDCVLTRLAHPEQSLTSRGDAKAMDIPGAVAACERGAR